MIQQGAIPVWITERDMIFTDHAEGRKTKMSTGQEQPEKQSHAEDPDPTAFAEAKAKSFALMGQATVELLLESAHKRNRHLSRAALDLTWSNINAMDEAIENRDRAIRRLHSDPRNTVGDPATTEAVAEFKNIYKWIEHHIRSNFRIAPNETAESTRLMLSMGPPTHLAAIREMLRQGETLEEQDPTKAAHRQVAGETAYLAGEQWKRLSRQHAARQLSESELARNMREWAGDAILEIKLLLPETEWHQPKEYHTPAYEPQGRRATPTKKDVQPTATRFHDKLIKIYQELDDLNSSQKHEQKLLQDDTVNRIMLDSRQAAIFREMGELPENMQQMIQLPFERFYLETTQPIWMDIALKEYQVVTLRAILVDSVATTPKFPKTEVSADISAWLSTSEEDTIFIRFLQHFTDGSSHIPVSTIRNSNQRSTLPNNIFLPATLPPETKDDKWIRVEPSAAAVMGSLQEMIWQCGQITNWMVAYMMAKAIEIAPETVSRQQRRLMERKGIPNPWHVVQVDPKIREQRERDGYAPSTGPRIRHDVIGHLRFGRHRRKDGTYAEHIEWVRPHQRGLANDIYVPKISNFKGGRNVHPKMHKYWGDAGRMPETC